MWRADFFLERAYIAKILHVYRSVRFMQHRKTMKEQWLLIMKNASDADSVSKHVPMERAPLILAKPTPRGPQSWQGSW
ncbi:MAG: hypothetical protein PWQ64_990 [Desulfomicrobiaceae bacterium]|jgi:hypothetical protein|nr:hypothetical protein [Desulfomicrobiaceae bacterium]